MTKDEQNIMKNKIHLIVTRQVIPTGEKEPEHQATESETHYGVPKFKVYIYNTILYIHYVYILYMCIYSKDTSLNE